MDGFRCNGCVPFRFGIFYGMQKTDDLNSRNVLLTYHGMASVPFIRSFDSQLLGENSPPLNKRRCCISAYFAHQGGCTWAKKSGSQIIVSVHGAPVSVFGRPKWTTSISGVIRGTMKTVFFAFGIIYLFWLLAEWRCVFVLHQSKCYSILLLLHTWSFASIILRQKLWSEQMCVLIVS